MNPIQIILTLGLLGAFLTYLSFFRSLLIDRVAAGGLFGVLFIAVLFPDATTTVANALGVGRGADLVMYIFAVGALFCLVLLYSMISHTRATQTEIIREIAIANARIAHDESRE